MTPKTPPAPEDPSPPQRQRPNLGDLVKDATELDLWAFDDLEPTNEVSTEEIPTSPARGIPMPRGSERNKPRPVVELTSDQPKPESKPTSSQNLVKLNAGKKITKIQTPGPNYGESTRDHEFHDLDHWDEPVEQAPIPEDQEEMPIIQVKPDTLLGIGKPRAKSLSAAAQAPESPVATVATATRETAPQVDEMDEFSPIYRPDATPISLRPHLGLSKFERLGLGILLGLLLLASGVAFLYTIHRLPGLSDRVKSNDFPIKGKLATIQSAETYWRPPVTEGKNAETFRRGTQLLPVVNLTASGGPAVIRVFFRDSDGQLIGDAVTRNVQTGGSIQVAATAGFADVGMHAAYRTGQSKPWTIEVYEAPTENTPGKEFEKLFEMIISTDRR